MESARRHLRAIETPSFAKNRLPGLVKTIREMAQDVAKFVDRTVLDLGQRTEDLLDPVHHGTEHSSACVRTKIEERVLDVGEDAP